MQRGARSFQTCFAAPRVVMQSFLSFFAFFPTAILESHDFWVFLVFPYKNPLEDPNILGDVLRVLAPPVPWDVSILLGDFVVNPLQVLLFWSLWVPPPREHLPCFSNIPGEGWGKNTPQYARFWFGARLLWMWGILSWIPFRSCFSCPYEYFSPPENWELDHI